MAPPADGDVASDRAPRRRAIDRRARGAEVESAARRHLLRAGLEDIAANANCRFGEIDLVMRDGDSVVFVEVRYRASDSAHREFSRAAKAAGARVLLLSTWGPDKTWQGKLDRAAQQLAGRLGADVVPAGPALRAYAASHGQDATPPTRSTRAWQRAW